MSVVTLIFAGWVLFNGYRGYKQGLWHSVFTVVGLLAAYIGCYLCAPDVSEWLISRGWSFVAAYALGYLGLYAVIYYLLAEGPGLLLCKSTAKSGAVRWSGAAFGCVVGVVSGLVFVWAYGLLQGALAMKSTNAQAGTSQHEYVLPVQGGLGKAANSLMAKIVSTGAGLAGVEPIKKELMSRFSLAPVETIESMRKFGQSPALESFLRDPVVDRYIAEGNVDGLIESASFQRVVSMPEIESVRRVAQAEAGDKNRVASVREGDLYLASQYVEARKKMNAMKDDPRVVAAMRDPEVREMIEQRDIPGLLSNKKVQQIMAVVMTGDTPPESPNMPSEQPAKVFLEQDSEDEQTPKKVYKWRDEHGKIQYSDTLPEDENIELINGIRYGE